MSKTVRETAEINIPLFGSLKHKRCNGKLLTNGYDIYKCTKCKKVFIGKHEIIKAKNDSKL